MTLSEKQIVKALTRLHTYTGWSAPKLFDNHRRQVFSRQGPFNISSAVKKDLISSVVSSACPLKMSIANSVETDQTAGRVV